MKGHRSGTIMVDIGDGHFSILPQTDIDPFKTFH